jgi:hypothetical protein
MRSRYDVGETWKLRKHLQDRFILEDKDGANYYNLTQKTVAEPSFSDRLEKAEA